jgi:DNA gyrase inhibitor GyrI
MINPDKIENIKLNLPLHFVRKYGNYNQAPLDAWKYMNELIDENHLDRSKIRYFGLSHHSPLKIAEEHIYYDAAIFTQQELKINEKMESQILKGGKYAIFSHHGAHDTLDQTFDLIFSLWYPVKCEKFDPSRSTFCEYLNLQYFITEPNKLLTILYIPLIDL